MSVSNELFELCKQVYEAVKWKGVGRKYINKPTEKDEWIPLYTSDYLLEKLPKKIKRDSSTGWLVLSPMDSQGAWSVGYEPDHTEHIDDYPMEWGESPVAALLKLTLKLHEEGIL